jgi:PEGA domain
LLGLVFGEQVTGPRGSRGFRRRSEQRHFKRARQSCCGEPVCCAHVVLVRKSGYQDLQSAIEITAGQGTTFPADLQSALGKLTVQTLPAAKVFVDGSDRGAADAQGYLAIYDMPVGTHQGGVRKPGYSEGQFTVELTPGETKNVPVLLKWTGGYLTIHASPPGTTIRVSGLGEFSGDWLDNPCPTGTYTIAASHVGMKAESRTPCGNSGLGTKREKRGTTSNTGKPSKITATA